MKKLRAFTLAEILIVIAIIGVVAAMVLPTLMDVGNEKVWQNQSNVFGSKMFTALKMMNQRGDLANLESTEDFVSNLGKYIRIVKTCPSATAYQCFDNNIKIKEGEKPKSVQEMGITTAENLGHEDWEDSNVMGVQFADGISALLAYNTLDCSPATVNAAENVWNSDVFNCVAIIFDVNSNGSPNEKGKDIKLVNAGGIGSAPKKCVGETCYALVEPTEPTDCTLAQNSVKCNVTGRNYYGNFTPDRCTLPWCAYTKDNYVVTAALMCKEMDMHLGTKAEIQAFTDTDEGKEYFAKMAGNYGIDRFVSSSGANLSCDCYLNSRFGWEQSCNVNGPSVNPLYKYMGVCVSD